MDHWKKTCQRVLGRLVRQIQHGQPVRARFLVELETSHDKLLKRGILPTHAKGNPVSPAVLFKNGIDTLNEQFKLVSTVTGPPSAGNAEEEQRQDAVAHAAAKNGQSPEPQLAQSLLVSARPEQAAFLQDIHTAQAAGDMFHGAIVHTQDRIKRLIGAVDPHQEWTTLTEKRLGHVGVRLDGAEAWVELRIVVNEVVSVIEEWLSMIREQYDV
jgi:hypothetical protein